MSSDFKNFKTCYFLRGGTRHEHPSFHLARQFRAHVSALLLLLFFFCLIVGPLLLAIVFWHLYEAYKRRGVHGFLAYLIPRATFLVWFGFSAAYLELKDKVHVHLHHLYIGWSLALWCDMNSQISLAGLAIGSGIFVQGIGAYSFAPIFSSGKDCFETPSADSMHCKFWADAPFTVQVCPLAGITPNHACA